MSKYKFTNTQRFCIWNTYQCKCFWCGEPLEYKHTTVDHLFAEKIAADPIELIRVKRVYALPADFGINDFCNWVPSHASCNAKKSSKVIRNFPVFQIIVDDVSK